MSALDTNTRIIRPPMEARQFLDSHRSPVVEEAVRPPYRPRHLWKGDDEQETRLLRPVPAVGETTVMVPLPLRETAVRHVARVRPAAPAPVAVPAALNAREVSTTRLAWSSKLPGALQKLVANRGRFRRG